MGTPVERNARLMTVRGETRQVLVTVFNSGEVTAIIDTIEFNESIGIYTITNPQTFQSIAPGDSQIYNFDFFIDQNSATGNDFIDVTVLGNDSIIQIPEGVKTIKNALFWNNEILAQTNSVLEALTLTLSRREREQRQ